MWFGDAAGNHLTRAERAAGKRFGISAQMMEMAAAPKA